MWRNHCFSPYLIYPIGNSMKQNRRAFLQSAPALFLGGAFYHQTNKLQLHALPDEGTDSDAYWKMLRRHFPLRNDLVYLNNGTMGPSPYYVIEQTQQGMLEADEDANYGGWENTHQQLAAFIGADETEIALTRNVTEGINIICNGLYLTKGDEVIITTHEHGGNAFPWLNIARNKGVILRTFTPAPTADETLNRLEACISKRTKVIAVPHILCTQGQILPIKEISALGKRNQLFVFIDGAHGPGMVKLNMKELGCDAYATCCHKWMLGPKGTGFLYINKNAFEKVQPIFVGAGSDNAKWTMATQPPTMGEFAPSAHRYYAGTFNAGLYKGVIAALQFIESVGEERWIKRIETLGNYTQQQLLNTDKVEMLTPVEQKSRSGVIGFRIKGINSTSFYELASKQRIRIRQVHENGLNSLRVSTHIYNHTSEVDKLIELIKKS